jgi:curved DNA-binding protein CbpA
MAIDPYRTLGLEPGASPAEIKRAYRRLAKAFHPDSAGEAALPRFLAIHEAYDALTGSSPGVRAHGGSATAASSRPSAEPWRADPARARAAREQARTRRARPGAPADGTRPASGSGTRERGAEAGPGSRRAGEASGGAPGARGRAASAGSSAGGASGASAGPQAKSGRRRTTRKATLGSTSYDEARDPADPTWGGGAWYGPTSGEYWTVNPREYADPRKHGPEYQSRARRGSTTATGAWPEDVPEPESGPTARARDGAEPFDRPRPNGAAEARTEPAGARARPRPERRWMPPTFGGPTTDGPSSPPPGPSVGPRLASVLGADLGDPMRRLGFALLAWAPLGLAAAAVIGQLTGCTAYSASCDAAEPLLPWLAQAAILGILLLIPALSRILAVGTLALLLVLFPLAGFFVAFGGAGQSEGAATLVVLLSAAWVAGVGAAIASAWRVRAPGPSS